MRHARTIGPIGVALTAAVCFASTRTEADELPAASAVKAEPARRWYGWQTLIVDAASFTLAASVPGPGPGLGGFGYLFGGLAVHAAHGNGGRAAASLAVRLTLPVVGLLAGAALDRHTANCNSNGLECSDNVGSLDGMAYGFLAGMGTAIVIDAAVLSWDTPPAPPRASFVPIFAARAHSAVLGLGGAF